ncbi:hypothetical protein [Pedobacter sp.]|uniref:hypothetical protein n=1 Tax=Pedobacter sp. TaxID=1411316 RepID=UPI003C59EF18
MKTLKIFLLIFSIVFTFTLTSCSTTLRFLNSSVVPAAKGSVKVSKDDNNNYAIQVKITNLAEPERLQPKKELYVVWLVTEDQITKNIGRLNSTSSFFSDALEGQLSTVSSFKPDHFFITAEDNSSIQYPTGTVVLTTKSN